MLTKIRKKSEGFTIVEVMIVLAIAGLILVVVLMAVPALNRTARNNRRKTDVTALLGAITEYTNNNGGALPPNTAAITDLAKLSYYDAASEVNYVVSTAAVTAEPGTDANVVYIRNYAKCNGNAIQSTTGATRRNVVAYFRVETSNGTMVQCQET